MATKRVCDVFGTTKGVEQYEIVVERTSPDAEGTPPEESGHVLLDQHVDLCERGLARLLKKIQAGCERPKRHRRTESEQQAND